MPFASPHAALSLPPADGGLLLPHFLLDPAKEAPNANRASQPVLHPPPPQSDVSSRPSARPLSLNDAARLAYRIALGLLKGSSASSFEFQKGDTIAFYSPNQHDYVPILLGIQLAGGVGALCNPSYKPQELAHQLRMTNARAVLTSAGATIHKDKSSQKASEAEDTPLARAREAVELAHSQNEDGEQGFPSLSRKPEIFVFDEEHDLSIHKLIAHSSPSLTDEERQFVDQESKKRVSSTDAAVFCFSSGTSGLPKAVSLTHSNLVSNTIQATFLLYDRMNEAIDTGKRFSPDGRKGWYDDAEEKGAGREIWSKWQKLDGQQKAPKASSGFQKSLGRITEQVKKTFSIKGKGEDTAAKSPVEKEVELPPSGYLTVPAEDGNTDASSLTGFSRIESRPRGEQEFHIDVLPQFHCYGLLVNLVAVHTLTPRIILPRFHLETYLSSVQEHGITFSFVVPPILLALAKHPLVDKYDVSTLWRVASGAASLPDEIANAVRKRLGILATDGYGMTEMSPIVAMQTLRDVQRAPNTVGVLAPNTEALVIDEAGNECAADEEGELLLHGPQMMNGYLRNDEANEKAFYTDKDGARWLRTGDVVRIDKRGYITITDRLKDVIKAKGFQVSPAELEALLFKDERVQDVAVIGTKDESGDAEQPWAFIVSRDPLPKEQGQRDQVAKSILSRVNEQVAGYKKIAGVTWLDVLPKSEAGKVLKKNLAFR